MVVISVDGATFKPSSRSEPDKSARESRLQRA
jgi:hypothetical protein